MTSIEMVTVEPTLGLRIYGDLQIAPRRSPSAAFRPDTSPSALNG
jgi:hypothetical protein